jgi:hypothetical protein
LKQLLLFQPDSCKAAAAAAQSPMQHSLGLIVDPWLHLLVEPLAAVLEAVPVELTTASTLAAAASDMLDVISSSSSSLWQPLTAAAAAATTSKLAAAAAAAGSTGTGQKCLLLRLYLSLVRYIPDFSQRNAA